MTTLSQARRIFAARLRAGHRWVGCHPYLWAAAVVAAVTGLAQAAAAPDASNIPLLYFLAVLLCAATVGLRPAIACALGAFAAYNFFFVEPIHTLHVNRPQDMLRLVLFLVTASVGGGLAARLRERAELAERRNRELAALYELSQAISVQLDFGQVAPLVLAATLELLGCRGARLALDDGAGGVRDLAQAGSWSDFAPIARSRLQAGGAALGVLEAAVSPEQRPLRPEQQRLLDTLAAQAALALQRSELARAAAHADALAESDRLKSALLSSVSHDFRTPLAAITAAADELRSDDVGWSPAATSEFGAVIWQQANRLNYLVANLLDLSRIEAGVLRPRIGWYNIAEIAEKARDRLGAELDGRALLLDVPDDLPLAPVDYVQIEQVIWNLLQNAVKYSPPGAPIARSRLQAGGAALGVLEAAVSPEQRPLRPEQQRLLDTLAAQAALALQRSELARAAAHADALAESDQLKSALLSSVSHDFRTPLAAITAAADELRSDDVGWSPAATSEFGAVIWQQANRLNYLVANLLDLSRIEAGVLRPRIGWYNIAEIAEKARDRLGAELDGRALLLDVPDDLPLAPVDYVQIEQVIWNLLQNAVKYSPPGAPIAMSAAAERGWLRLDIADRGPGVPAGERRKVFEKFYRLEGAEGVGIGLAICKGLAEANGGTVELLGGPAGGALARLLLPPAPAGAKELRDGADPHPGD